MVGVAQVTYGLQPLAPEGEGWPTQRKHILTSSIMSRGVQRHHPFDKLAHLLWAHARAAWGYNHLQTVCDSEMAADLN